MKYVVIVNGKPGSGKTTFEKACNDYLDVSHSAWCYIVSSIAPIKDIYKKLGWDGKKTDKARKDLSTLKQMWIDNCNGPVMHMVKHVVTLSDDEDHVTFVDVREESEIIKLKETLELISALSIKCVTVFIDRPDVDGFEYGNKSDDMVGSNMSLYDVIIKNTGNVSRLKEHAKKFIDTLLLEG